MMIYDLPKTSQRFVEIHEDILMRCECCERLTIAVAADRFFEVDWSGTLLGCALCGWENRPADETGNPLDAEPPEDRNDGLSLDEAKSNFERFAWMYDPENPPEWLGTPISTEERQLREQLRDAFPVSIEAANDFSERWELVVALQEALDDLVQARQRRTEAGLDPDGG